MMINQQPSSLRQIVQNRLCTGCGACAALAPAHITMRETADENRRPDIKASIPKELEAGLARACPGATEVSAGATGEVAQAWGPVLEVWEGYATDKEIRFNGSSGGAVTALALYALEAEAFSGALHVKARKENPRYNEAALSCDRGQLLEGAGSRYAPASVADRLDLVAEAQSKCIVIGKPCDIAGANAAAALNAGVRRNLGLTISIFCAGAPSHEGTAALLKALAPENPGTLTGLRYRGNGWPGDMVADWMDKDGKMQSRSTSYADGWGNILQRYRQWRCHTCADHTGEVADISVGDPWQTPPEQGGHGKSLIVVRTARGLQMLRRAVAAGYLKVERRDPSVLFAAQPNLYTTKGAVWGRRLVQGLSGRRAPTLRSDSFRCWLALPMRAKAQSLLGTLKRVIKRKLYRPKTTNWQTDSAC